MHQRVRSAEFRRLRLVGAAAALAGAILLAPALEAEAALRSGPDYRLATDPRPTRGKDAIGFAVNPRNSRQVVQVNADWLNGECEYGFSRNRGRSWRGRDLQAPPGFSATPCVVGPHLASHMSASVQWGGRKRVYTTFVSPRLNAQGEPEGKSLLVARSNNGGRTFNTAVVAVPGGPNAEDGPDFTLPKLAVDPGRKRDRVYVVATSSEAQPAGGADREDTVMTISSNSGASFGAPIRLNEEDEHTVEPSEPVVGRDGNVYLAWRTKGRGQRPGTFTPQGFITVAKSADRGRTWTTSRVTNVNGYTYEGPPTPPFTTTRSFPASTFPRMAIDRRRNRLYMVFGDGGIPTLASREGVQKSDHFIHPDEDVWFQRSTDSAGTWTAPRRINEDSPREISQTRHPHVGVAPNGRVDIVWDDRRHWYRGCVHTHSACQEIRLGDVYYSYSDRGTTFSRNRRLNNRSTALDVGYDYRFGTGWAYGPYPVALGNRQLLVGWMDTRRGNFENDTQDIFLTRVRHNARARVPGRRVRSRDLRALSVRLSRLAYPGGPEAVLAGTFATRPWARPVIVNEEDPAAMLVGAVLARANIATVLVAPAGGLPERVQSEVARLRPVGAYVLGDESKLSQQVVADLVEAGVPEDEIERLAGGSDAGTAALAARAMDRRTAQQRSAGAPAFDAVMVANPASPDAAAVSAWAAHRRLPVLYTERDSVPQATADAIRDLGIERTFVIGPARWISNDTANDLPSPTRLGGKSVAATSRVVVRESRRWQLPGNMLYVGDSKDPDAVSLMGSSVARLGGVLAVSPKPARRARRVASRLRLPDLLDRIVVVQSRR